MLDRRPFSVWPLAALALPLAFSAVAPAAAQDDERPPWREAWEVEPTNAFAEVDVRSTADDRRDLWEIRDIQRQLREARRLNDPITLRSAERRLMVWIEDELAEDQFEVDAELRELARAEAADPQRVAIERMELSRARADLAETQRAREQLMALRLAVDEGRASEAHDAARDALIARLVRLAEDEVRVSGEEERQDREAYLDTLRTAPRTAPPTGQPT